MSDLPQGWNRFTHVGVKLIKVPMRRGPRPELGGDTVCQFCVSRKRRGRDPQFGCHAFPQPGCDGDGGSFVFIEDTPEDVAKLVAFTLESS